MTDAGVLDLLGDLIVVLDHDGVIVAANAEWRRRAAERAADLARSGPGCDYLAVCEAGAAHGDPFAAEAAAAVRAVLAGGSAVTFRYPCEAPDGVVDWFEVSVRAAPAGCLVVHRDVSEAVRAGEDRQRTERRYRALIEQSPEALCVVDAQGIVQFATPGVTRLTGRRPEEVVGRDSFTWVHPDDAAAIRAKLAADATRSGTGRAVEMRMLHVDGTWRWVEALPTNLTHVPEVGGVVVNSRDVTSRVQAQQRLREQARILALVARGAPLGEVLDAICRAIESQVPEVRAAVLVAEDGLLQVAAAPGIAPEWSRAIDGLPVDAADRPCGRAASTRTPVFSPDAARDPRWHEQWRTLARRNGIAAAWCLPIDSERNDAVLGELSLYATRAGTPDDDVLDQLRSWVTVASVAIERARDHRDLAYAATHDPLTGLANRALFADRATTALALGARTGSPVTIALLDLDRFKVVNDTLGHSAGDAVLVELAARLADAVRPGDTVARLGGDEFAVCAPGLGGEDATAFASRLLDVARSEVSLGSSTLRLASSIGVVTTTPGDTRSVEDLLRDVDVAMYDAKAAGRGRYSRFDRALRERLTRRAELEAALAEAPGRGELFLHLQPILDLDTGRIGTVESLLRWQRGDRLVPPAEFIPLAEECGLITVLGDWVLREAAWHAATLRHRLGPDAPALSVNVAAAQLEDIAFPGRIVDVLRAEHLTPAALCIEVTESSLVERDEAVAALRVLHEAGIGIHLDDFGTGYSSLAYLQLLPLDAVKLDRRFTARLGADPAAGAVAGAVVGLAAQLGLEVIVEGIETGEQLDLVRGLGCRWGQGFLLGRPMPLADLVSEIERRAARTRTSLRSR